MDCFSPRKCCQCLRNSARVQELNQTGSQGPVVQQPIRWQFVPAADPYVTVELTPLEEDIQLDATLSLPQQDETLFLIATSSTPTIPEFLRKKLACRMSSDKPLGTGYYGVTYALIPSSKIWFQSEALPTQELALKTFALEHYQDERWFQKRALVDTIQYDIPEERLRKFQKEAEDYGLLHHEAIVPFLGAFQFWYNQKTGGYRVVQGYKITPVPPGYFLLFGGILMEKATDSLRDWMDKSGWNLLPEEVAIELRRQIGGALAYMHRTHAKIHNDLHSGNVGVYFAPNGKLIFKLMDFGNVKTLTLEPNRAIKFQEETDKLRCW